jgi:hypothetical protein
MDLSLQEWTSDELITLIGFSDETMVEFTIELSKSSSSPLALFQSLLKNDFKNDDATKRFCLALYKRIHGETNSKSASSATQVPTSGDLARASARMKLISEPKRVIEPRSSVTDTAVAVGTVPLSLSSLPSPVESHHRETVSSSSTSLIESQQQTNHHKKRIRRRRVENEDEDGDSDQDEDQNAQLALAALKKKPSKRWRNDEKDEGEKIGDGNEEKKEEDEEKSGNDEDDSKEGKEMAQQKSKKEERGDVSSSAVP